MTELSFEALNRKFSRATPSSQNGLAIYTGLWKYDFEKLAFPELYKAIMSDPRPQWCAETFPDFGQLRIVELGPADGYNTAALEYRGATRLIAIEGNSDCFMRSLILKNHLGLKATFLLGDFEGHFDFASSTYDLVYASGVLYHLRDPLRFLLTLSQKTKYLYLWTHVYDSECVGRIENERAAFANGLIDEVTVAGVTAHYYRRAYDLRHVASAGYIGGLEAFASWITREDLFRALAAYGFDVLKIIDDPCCEESGMMPAVNVLASRRVAACNANRAE